MTESSTRRAAGARAVGAALVAALMLVTSGCAAKSDATTTTTTKPARGAKQRSSSQLNINTDPCAMRLHDVCAPLLLFYGRYQTLPDHVEELAQVPGVGVPELACPVSHEKYVYNLNGPTGTASGTRIILYDATPAHAGRRWGIEVREPSRGQALVAKVVIVPNGNPNPR